MFFLITFLILPTTCYFQPMATCLKYSFHKGKSVCLTSILAMEISSDLSTVSGQRAVLLPDIFSYTASTELLCRMSHCVPFKLGSQNCRVPSQTYQMEHPLKSESCLRKSEEPLQPQPQIPWTCCYRVCMHKIQHNALSSTGIANKG